ncbi:DUF3741-associated sequence motif [Sesbania bispinosa]|nr:DUF3741-associated sequence motif [Sesbania bispinosa]
MAKKVHAHKRQNAGLKSPRNNMELQVETSQIHYPERELPYSCQEEDSWSKNNSYSNAASVKKLNNEEQSKQSGTRNNAPSLVARLMGVDMMPLDTKSVVPLPSDESISENMERKFSKKGMNKRVPVSKGSSNFHSYSQMELDSFYQDFDDDGWGQNFGKPRPREHPQEEELQKFKKEFEAYQAARIKECSKVVQIGSVSMRILAQENLNKEKVPHIPNSQREATEKSAELDSHSFTTKLPNDDIVESISTKKKESFPSRNKTLSRGCEESLMMKSRSIIDICSSPTQIVILKPGPDRICNGNHEDNWISSSSTLHGRDSIENFLEEVRERLNCELQGKTVIKGSVCRGNGIDTAYNEKPFDPKEIAHHIAKERDRLKQVEDDKKCTSDISQWRILKEKENIQTGSFRHGLDDNLLLHKDLSPSNLVRSLSAPVSGTSFEKLLLEDRHILTGALIRRKLEAVETIHVDVKKQKKDRFNIKEKVSHFKYTFGLRRKLFGKTVQSMIEARGNEVRDIRSGPTVLMKYGERHENYTEVPPSPASVCSCTQEELWRLIEYLNPISNPDVSSVDNIGMSEDFRDIGSGLNEKRMQLSRLESDGPEDYTTKQDPFESELVQLEDPAESYIRDLLVASGLYFGSWDKCLTRWDSFAKPIGNSVFEEVEESHKKLVKENERSKKDQNESKLEHKVLLDLLNEALSIVLGPPLTLPRFRRKLSNSSIQPPPCGRELLKLVWDIICVSLYPSSNTSPYSLDRWVAHDLRSISWPGLMNDQINIMEREIACLITDDLVEEFIKNMLLGVV